MYVRHIWVQGIGVLDKRGIQIVTLLPVQIIGVHEH